MAYRNIRIESGSNIKIKDAQLIINDVSIPIEDINSLMLENRSSNISIYALAKLAESGAVTFVCDEKHLPSGILLPLNQHSRCLKQLRLQTNASKPLLKQMWKSIVQQKIFNQGRCLEFRNKESSYVKKLSERVQSGDKTNLEAQAAIKYFRLLFGTDFLRREDDIINAALNYGYAIFRGCIARTIVVHGFDPVIGINHHSELNAFNLADDLIECYRPLVDLYVADNLESWEKGELSSQIKRELYNLVNYDVRIGDKTFIFSSSVDIVVESYLRSLQSGINKLELPELIALKQHKYE